MRGVQWEKGGLADKGNVCKQQMLLSMYALNSSYPFGASSGVLALDQDAVTVVISSLIEKDLKLFSPTFSHTLLIFLHYFETEYLSFG